MHFFCNALSLSYLYDFVAINTVLLGYSWTTVEKDKCNWQVAQQYHAGCSTV